ncbi:YceD family protein [Corynebacterium kroppenstedtii]|uniref:YceD family protein n=1 Tax=Corynebacterium kroppenstedtii TaxID=161879 RepID=UPI003873C6D6
MGISHSDRKESVTPTAHNPLSLDVSTVSQQSGAVETIDTEGPSPVRIGPEMIAFGVGTPLGVHATVTNVGEGLVVDAEISGSGEAECVRCLKPLIPHLSFHINGVWALTEGFITSEDSDDDDDDDPTPMVKDNRLDLTQAVIDEAGVSLPFSPTCEEFGEECDSQTPEPDGVSGETETVDPRWAGLQDKLKDLRDV